MTTHLDSDGRRRHRMCLKRKISNGRFRYRPHEYRGLFDALIVQTEMLMHHRCLELEMSPETMEKYAWIKDYTPLDSDPHLVVASGKTFYAVDVNILGETIQP